MIQAHTLSSRAVLPARTAAPLLLLVMALGACAAPPAGPATGAATGAPVMQVFKSRSAVQCGDRGTPPEVMRAELERVGIRVHRATCGTDGRMRPTVCGGGTGELNLFNIAASDQARAQALGFAPVSQLRGGAEAVPCR